MKAYIAPVILSRADYSRPPDWNDLNEVVLTKPEYEKVGVALKMHAFSSLNLHSLLKICAFAAKSFVSFVWFNTYPYSKYTLRLNASKMMKTVHFTTYGNSQSLQIGEKEKPVPKKGEVLVKIKASSINDWDWALLRGRPFVNRLLFGLFKPKVKTLGIDISGIIESVGQGVEAFPPGTEVYGDISAENWGGYAEYVCVNPKALSVKPSNRSHIEAATIPHSGVLAIQCFLDHRKIQAGDDILINGGGGGAGTLAIQMGKHLNARVTAVDKRSKFDTMQRLGADELVDYQQTDFTKMNKTYDLIIDFAGNHELLDYKRALNPDGIYLLVGATSSLIIKTMVFGPVLSKFSNKNFRILMHDPNKHLDTLTQWVEQGILSPTVGQIYPLDAISEAFDDYGFGSCNGKVCIRIE